MKTPNYPLASEGVWRELFPRAPRGGPALFLDRDGVVIEDPGYLCRAEDMELIAGASEIIRSANSSGVPVVVVTNQGGVGRGYYGWREFAAVQEALQAMLNERGARFDAVYACAHHPEAAGTFAHPNHPDRKPNPGMLLRAAADLSLDMSRSWLVGDHRSDIEAAKNAGLAGAIHVLTGHGQAERPTLQNAFSSPFELRLADSITAALDLPLLESAKKRIAL